MGRYNGLGKTTLGLNCPNLCLMDSMVKWIRQSKKRGD